MPPKKSKPAKRKLAVRIGGINRDVEKTSLVSLRNAAAEVGNTLDVDGTWWKNVSRSTAALAYKCTVVDWQPRYQWPTSSRAPNVPDGAFILRVEGVDDDPYPMCLVDYSKFAKEQALAVADDTPALLEEAPAEKGASAAITQAVTSKLSLLWKYVVCPS